MFPEFIGRNAVTLFEYFYVVSKVFVSYHFCDFILFIFIICNQFLHLLEPDICQIFQKTLSGIFLKKAADIGSAYME